MLIQRIIPSLFLVMILAPACSDDGDDPALAGDTPAATAPASPTAAATGLAPQATATTPPPAADTAISHPPGGTNPVSVAPVPAPPTGASILTDVRVGAHPELGGWDRIVFEFEETLLPGQIRYVALIVHCGSGEPVNLKGGAILAVTFTAAQAHNEAGNVTIDATELDGPGFAIIESRQICDFEGQVTWAIGVISPQSFTVVTLINPARVVIDVKQ